MGNKSDIEIIHCFQKLFLFFLFSLQINILTLKSAIFIIVWSCQPLWIKKSFRLIRLNIIFIKVQLYCWLSHIFQTWHFTVFCTSRKHKSNVTPKGPEVMEGCNLYESHGETSYVFPVILMMWWPQMSTIFKLVYRD